MNVTKPIRGAMWFFALLLAIAFVPAVRAQGTAEATYKAKCAGCHGPDGTGMTAAGKAMKVRDFHYSGSAKGNRGRIGGYRHQREGQDAQVRRQVERG